MLVLLSIGLCRAREAGGPPPPFAALGLHVALSQALLVTRSVKGKVWTIIPEDGTSLAAAAGKFRAFEIGLLLSIGPCRALEAGGPPPHFAALGLGMRLSQAVLLTRSVLGKVWRCLPVDGTPVTARAW